MTRVRNTMLLLIAVVAAIALITGTHRAGRYSPKPKDLQPDERLVKVTTTWFNSGKVTKAQVNIDVGSQNDSGRRATPYTKTVLAHQGDDIDVNVSVDPARAFQMTCEAWVTSRNGGTHQAPLVKVFIIPQAQLQCTGQVP